MESAYEVENPLTAKEIVLGLALTAAAAAALYFAIRPASAAASPAAPSAPSSASFVPGSSYQLIFTDSSGITDPTAIVNILSQLGWTVTSGPAQVDSTARSGNASQSPQFTEWGVVATRNQPSTLLSLGLQPNFSLLAAVGPGLPNVPSVQTSFAAPNFVAGHSYQVNFWDSALADAATLETLLTGDGWTNIALTPTGTVGVGPGGVAVLRWLMQGSYNGTSAPTSGFAYDSITQTS